MRVALGEGWLDARVIARDTGADPLPDRGGPAVGPGLPAGSTLTPPPPWLEQSVRRRVSQESKRKAAGTGGEETYDGLVARLENVVGELESGQLTLEQSVERFAEGVRLAREASRKLDEAERKVELLVRSADGEEEAVAFDPESGRTG